MTTTEIIKIVEESEGGVSGDVKGMRSLWWCWLGGERRKLVLVMSHVLNEVLLAKGTKV